MARRPGSGLPPPSTPACSTLIQHIGIGVDVIGIGVDVIGIGVAVIGIGGDVIGIGVDVIPPLTVFVFARCAFSA